jgi:hypothetical protein
LLYRWPRFSRGFLVCVQYELLAPEVFVEEIHVPDCSGCLQKEWQIIHLMILELPRGEIALNFPSLSTWVRMAPRPPGMLAIQVGASVMSAYYLSPFGKAMTGAWRAASTSSPDM